MAQIDKGPATPGGQTAVLQTTIDNGIEFHVPSGVTSLSPSQAPYVDPSGGMYLFNVTGGGSTTQNGAVNTTLSVAGAPGVTIKFAIPA